MIFGLDVDALRRANRHHRRRSLRLSGRASRRQARANTTCKRSCNATKLFIAPTAPPSSCPWIAAKASTGSRARQFLLQAAENHRCIPAANLDSRSTRSFRRFPDRQTREFIRHIKIQSDSLTKFWGRPMYLGANVLVPEGFDAHPEAHFPLMIFHGHFPADFHGFRTKPPDPNLKPDYSERFHICRLQQNPAGRSV